MNKFKNRSIGHIVKKRSEKGSENWIKLLNSPNICFYCDVDLKETTTSGYNYDNTLSYDHLIPVCAGGKTMTSNIVKSCHKCNNKKGKQSAELFSLNFSTEKQNEVKERIQKYYVHLKLDQDRHKERETREKIN